MPDGRSSGITVEWTGGVPTVTVHGELDPGRASQARERIAGVLRDCPRRLVLDLLGVSDRHNAECLALIAVARHLLPSGCAFTVRSDDPAVRQILGLAGWSGVQVLGGTEEPEAV